MRKTSRIRAAEIAIAAAVMWQVTRLVEWRVGRQAGRRDRGTR